MNSIPIAPQTTLLSSASNVFVTFAWYGQLKNLAEKPWYVAALVSWGIALCECLSQVPAHRIDYSGGFSLGRIKIYQEVLTLAVFVLFSMPYKKLPFRTDCLWAGLSVVGAVCFIFRA